MIYKKNLHLKVLLPLLLIVLVAGICFGFADGTAQAKGPDYFIVAQISDIHYFPYDECFVTDDNEAFLASDYYRETCTDTKLVLESGTLLSAVIRDMASLPAAELPDILLVTGDLTKNGELCAMVDVANALRLLQEKIRERKTGFQVLVVPGNHDLYNGYGAVYDDETGKEYQADTVDTATFVKLFAGLGFPALTGAELQFAQDNWKSNYIDEYIESELSPYFSFDHFYNAPGVEQDDINYLSYYVQTGIGYDFFMLDTTDRYPTNDIVPVRKMTTEAPSTANEKSTTYIHNAERGYVLWNKATPAEREAATAAGEFFYNAGYQQSTGGRINAPCEAWLQQQTAFSGNNTIISAHHQNVLPQFKMEDEVLKDFTLYNWEYIAKMYLECGIRYSFSGHMHASDIQTYLDNEGRVLWSIETGSTVSLRSPVRYTRFIQQILGGEDVETWQSYCNDLSDVQSLHLNDDTVTIANHPEYFVCKDIEGIDDMENYIDENLYTPLISKFVSAFLNQAQLNSLTAMLEGMLVGDDSILSDLAGGIFSSFGEILYKIANKAIDNIVNDLDSYAEGEDAFGYLTDIIDDVTGLIVYSEGGKDFRLGDLGVRLFMAHLIGEEFRSLDEAQNTEQGRAVLALLDGLEDGSTVKKLFDILLDPLLYSENSLLKSVLGYRFDFTGVLNEDEEAAFNGLIDLLNNYINNLADTELDVAISLDNFCLNDILVTVLPMLSDALSDMLGLSLDLGGHDTIAALAEELLDKYLTDSFYVGIGGLAYEIIYSLAVDPVPDDVIFEYNSEFPFKLLYDEDDTITYGGSIREITPDFIRVGDDPAVERLSANGQLPSHLFAAHGLDPKTEYRFQWYTAYESKLSSKFQYRKAGETEWQYHAIIENVVAVEIPLIDLGLFATTTKTVYLEGEEERNIVVYTGGSFDFAATRANFDKVEKNSVYLFKVYTVELSGLEPGEVYEYRVAGVYDGTIHFWLQDILTGVANSYYTFKTAPAAATPFSLLAIADIQGMLKSNYTDSLEVFEAIKASSRPDLNYSFIMNAGDNVDSGGNIKQWGYHLNILSKVWGNTAMYSAAGNHEDGGYELVSYLNYATDAPTQDKEKGIYYSFDYSNARFIVLNTNDANSSGLGADQQRAQLNWLKGQLEAAAIDKEAGTIDWTIILMHKGLYTAGSHSRDAEVVAMRNTLTTLFYDYDVDLVLQGHDHTYTTTEFIDRFGNVMTVRPSDAEGYVENPHGVLYITLGTLGGKFYEYQENDEVTPLFDLSNTVQKTLNTPTFASITIDGKKLKLIGYKYEEGTISVISTSAIIKTQNLGSEINVAAFTFKDVSVPAAEGALIKVKRSVNPRDFGFVAGEGFYPDSWKFEVMKSGVWKEIKDKSITFSLGANQVRFTVYSEDGSTSAIYTFTVYQMSDQFFTDKAKFIASLTLDGNSVKDGKAVLSFFSGNKPKLEYDAEALAKHADGTTLNSVAVIVNLKGKSGEAIVRVFAEDGSWFDIVLEAERENYELGIALFSVGGFIVLAGAAAAVVVPMLLKKRAALATIKETGEALRPEGEDGAEAEKTESGE